MIIVDTMIWADHLVRPHRHLVDRLQGRGVLMHPFVVGELLLGNLRDRANTVKILLNLPQAEIAFDTEVLDFIEHNQIAGSGIGYVDAHLLVATRLQGAATIWTNDRRLLAVARRLGIAYEIEAAP